MTVAYWLKGGSAEPQKENNTTLLYTNQHGFQAGQLTAMSLLNIQDIQY